MHCTPCRHATVFLHLHTGVSNIWCVVCLQYLFHKDRHRHTHTHTVTHTKSYEHTYVVTIRHTHIHTHTHTHTHIYIYIYIHTICVSIQFHTYVPTYCSPNRPPSTWSPWTLAELRLKTKVHDQLKGGTLIGKISEKYEKCISERIKDRLA